MSATLPDALLFTAPGCVHCTTVKRGLDELAMDGLVAKLTVVDVAAHPEQAAQHGVRSTPWLRLGAFTLTGAHSPAELRQWAMWASSADGVARYVEHLLGLAGSVAAKNHVEKCLNDVNAEVREIAADAMEALAKAK